MVQSPPNLRRPWWHNWWPTPVTLTLPERARVALGAVLGLGLTAGLSHALATALGVPGLWLIAPMGASTVLVFCVATGPLAQPGPVLGGHCVAVCVGALCSFALGASLWAGPLAVGLAITAMLALRCLHPPAGGTALMMTLGGLTNPMLAVFPVAFNAVILVLAGTAYHRLTGHTYPNVAGRTPPVPSGPHSPTLEEELDAVLSRHNQVLDISRDELQSLLRQTQWQAYQHRLDRLRCADIMARPAITVLAHSPLPQALGLLHQHQIKALPVVDAQARLLGIVTRADIERCANNAPALVASVMTQPVRHAMADQRLTELLPLFASTGHHHLPVLDAQQQVVGVLTQSDLIAALSTAPAST